MMPPDAILLREEKVLLKDALLLYISDLQGRYYRDHSIDPDTYFGKLSEIESIIEKLTLKDLRNDY